MVPAAELDVAVDELAATLAEKAPAAMRLGRDAFYDVLDLDVAHAPPARRAHHRHRHRRRAAEGMAAFREKRKPKWTVAASSELELRFGEEDYNHSLCLKRRYM